MKDRWTVINETIYDIKGKPAKLRRYLFGKNLNEYFEEDEIKNIEVVPYEKWTAEDFVEILSNEYEDANYHRFVNIPNIILEAVKERKYIKKDQDRVMRSICEALYKEI